MKRPSFSLLFRAFVLVACGGLLAVLPVRSKPPSGLVVEGVPDFPESFQQAIAPYWKVTGNLFLGWQPTTNAMLVCSTDPDTHSLHLLSAPMGERKMSTVMPDKLVVGSFMPKLGDTIVYTADHNGDELFQLFSLNPVTGQKQLLTDGNSRNFNIIFDHTGKRIAFLSTMPEAKYDVIYVMDPRNPDSRRVIMTPNSGGWMLQDWTHDGSHILALHLTSEGGFLWSIDANSGETTLVTKTKETQRFNLAARYSPDDTGLYVIVMEKGFGEPRRIIDYLPINGGVIGKVPMKVTDADEIELSPDGTWLAYVQGDEGSETLHLFNTTTGEELPKVPLEPALIGRLRWNDDGTEIGFNYGSATQPFEAFSYKLSTREVSQWTQTSFVGMPKAIKPELVKVHSFDGLEISCYLYRPDPQKFPGKRPVVISIHGGPASQFVPDFLGASNYYLDGMGVALLYPNVRGSTGYGGEFVNLDNDYKRENSVKDIGAVLDWIQSDPRLDSNRVGVQGGSYGGYMVLSTLFHYGNRVRCGSDMMGVTDFVTLLRHTKPFWQSSARWEFGDERYPVMNKFLESISPLNHAAEIHDPVMITAGKNDPRVPQSESDQMTKALRAQKGIVWYILGEDEGHGFRHTEDEQYQFAAEAYFFQTYLLPEQRLTPLGPDPIAPAVRPSAISAPD